MIIMIIIIIKSIIIIIVVIIIITVATSGVKESCYLYQRISVARQRFNAICIFNKFRDVLYDDVSG